MLEEFWGRHIRIAIQGGSVQSMRLARVRGRVQARACVMLLLG